MTYTVFARKYRPQTFSDLVGQEHVTRTLSNAITSDRVAHAFLFTGVRGVGKTTSARILAKALNCLAGPTPTPCNACDACSQITAGVDLDVLEIDGASNNGVEDVRRLQESIPYRPTRDRYKIVIVDEVHMLSTGAFNAFLKTIEEPPAHVKFIFATTESHKVPVTIRSRCQRYDFRLIPQTVIEGRLRDILAREEITADERALSIVAREAAGSMRDALTLLDQVVAFAGSALRGDEVARHLGIADREHLHALCEAVLKGDGKRALDVIDEVAEQGLDLLHFTRQCLDLLRDAVVLRVAGDRPKLVELPAAERASVVALTRGIDVLELERAFAGVAQLVEEVARSSAPRTVLEMGAVRLATRPPLRDLAALVARLDALERSGGSGGAGPGGPIRPPASSAGPRSPVPQAGPPAPSARASAGVTASPVVIHDTRPTIPARPSATLSAGAQAFQRFMPQDFDTVAGAEGRGAGVARPVLPARPLTETTVVSMPAAALPQPSAATDPSPPSGTGAQPPNPVGTGAADSWSSHAQPESAVTEAHGDWRRIVSHIREHEPRWSAMYNHGVPGEVSSQRVEVLFLEGSFFGRQAQSTDGSGALRRSVASVFGPDAEVVVRCVPQLRGTTVAQLEASETDHRKESLKKEALSHPRVVEALKVFPELSTKQDIQVDPD